MPFIIGLIFFFLNPLLKSVVFSLSDMRITAQGYELQFVGLKHYRHILFIDAEYTRVLFSSILGMVKDVPMIIFFSLFAAILLNQKFYGRTLTRVIFFLPVILASGIVLRLEQTDFMTTVVQNADLARVGGHVGFSDATVRQFLLQLRLPRVMLDYLMLAIDNVALIIRASGIQVLIFLAGLQSISPSLYEAADVEGVSSWERFWLITFPQLTPLVITNVVYSIVDYFTASTNNVMTLIHDAAFSTTGYSTSSAMAWLYFGLISLILIIVAIASRGVSRS